MELLVLKSAYISTIQYTLPFFAIKLAV